MKIFTSKILALSVACMAGVSGMAAAAPTAGHLDISKMRYSVESSSVFNDYRSNSIRRINSLLQKHGAEASLKAEALNPQPEFTFGPASETGDIDAPDGERWFYTGEFEYDEIPPHDDIQFTDRILKSYKYSIYDSEAKLVATISDKVDYADNEVRVPLCELMPLITRNFFNTDDKLEVIVGLGFNTTNEGSNTYRTVVYSLDGEKDADGDNVPVCVMPNLIGDVIEGPATDGKDNFYITFSYDSEDPAAGDTFWDFLMSYKINMVTYARATDETGPRPIFTTEIPQLQLPGDQENLPALITMEKDGEIYFVVQKYELPFYNDYNDPIMEELSQREGNNLIVSFYKLEGEEINHVYDTRIPVVHDYVERVYEDGSVGNDCICSYYGVGYMRYTGDFNFTGYDTPEGRAALTVCRLNYLASSDGDVSSFYVYNPDGTKRFDLWVNCDSNLSMSDIAGFAPQQMFVSSDAYGYMYNFVNLLTGKKECTIDYNYYIDEDSDPEILTANLDRVPAGDSYKYCVELRIPSVDDNENDMMRFIWLNKDGSYDHMDYVNMGQQVMYAQSYISSQACVKGAYSADNVAYMMLIKRGTAGEANEEQLLIAEPVSEENPEGKTLLLATPNANGVLASIVPYFGNPGELYLYRSLDNGRELSLEVYALPFGSSNGVTDVVADSQVKIQGNAVVADGLIKVYSSTGALVAAGSDNLDLSTLSAGIYVVVANGSATKIAVK